MDALAKETGLPYKTISRIELGQNLPSLPVLVRIANALGISLDALLGRAAAHGDGRPGLIHEDEEAVSVRQELQDLRRRMDLLEHVAHTHTR